MKRLLTWVSGPLLAIAFLWLTFRGADAPELLTRVRSASVPLLTIYFLSGVVHLFLRSWRWGTLLDPVRPRHELPLIERMSATAIGNMALVLPGRVGEVFRPALLSRRVGLPFGTTLSTVGVERVVLDLMAVLVFGAVGLMLPSRWSGVGASSDPEMIALLRSSGVVLLGASLAVLVAVATVARGRERLAGVLGARAARSRSRVAPVIYGWLAALLPGLAAFASRAGLARLAFETLIIWAVIAAGIHAGVVACGVSLAPLSSLILLPILAIGIGIPTPGGTGSYHAAMLIGVQGLFGASREAAQTAAIVVHAVTLITMIVLGGVFVVRGGLARPEASLEAVAGTAGGDR
ncbi:MAG: flippase-like domain-containing protein [Acidobacteriota bacterium]|nr:flippase-like domain-containing protein [Acidobacteriota bacterium]